MTVLWTRFGPPTLFSLLLFHFTPFFLSVEFTFDVIGCGGDCIFSEI